jgi:hypothetical protein
MCNTYAEDGLPKTYSQQVGAALASWISYFLLALSYFGFAVNPKSIIS